jgi:hypothetical protein
MRTAADDAQDLPIDDELSRLFPDAHDQQLLARIRAVLTDAVGQRSHRAQRGLTGRRRRPHMRGIRFRRSK